jgi:hypothetical protein
MNAPSLTLDAVPEALRPALTARGIATLTAVQAAVLSADPARDLRISSQTGSGKTVAFGLAIERALSAREERSTAPVALVITPTRELAAQVRTELSWLLDGLRTRVVAVTGGTSVRTEQKVLKSGADIVVGTPGRLADHIRTSSLDCSKLAMVVLDEADEMLDMGFRDDLEEILDGTPATRRTLLFSATIPKPIVQLAKRYQQDALRISTVGEDRGHGDIAYQAVTVAPADIEGAVVNLLRLHDAETAMLFCATRDIRRRRAVGRAQPERTQPGASGLARPPRKGLRRDRRRRSRHRSADAQPRHPRRDSSRRRGAPASFGPHRPRGQKGHGGHHRPLSAPPPRRRHAPRRTDRGRMDGRPDRRRRAQARSGTADGEIADPG